jgi:hypothetical protein
MRYSNTRRFLCDVYENDEQKLKHNTIKKDIFSFQTEFNYENIHLFILNHCQ